MTERAMPDKSAQATPPQAAAKRYVPGWISRSILAFTLVLGLVVMVAGRLDDPPFPLDDTSFRNVMWLVLCFMAGMTLWIWFCFWSSYPRWSKLTVAGGSVLGVIGLATFVASSGLTRVVHFSGSMIPHLVAGERAIAPLDAKGEVPSLDLASTTTEDFPQFLGPERSGWIAGPSLARDWKATPPRELWRRDIGAGWSAFSAVNGYAVTLEQRGEEEWDVCYEIATGKPIWGYSIRGRHENPLGGVGPRSTPTIYQGRVYVMGVTGVLRCLEGATGKLLWSDDLRKRYALDAATEEGMVMWGRAASPLIVDSLVVVPGGGPEGKAKNLVAFELESGRLAWEAENRLEDDTADQIAYASPALATLAGVRQILIVNESTASGHDPASGRRLWSHPWPGNSNGNASSSQAVPVGESRVLLTKGYSGGAELLELSPTGSGTGLTVKTVWRVPRVLQTKFTNVVVHDGHAYGLSEGILECVDLANGQRRWKSGRYGHGQILGVGDLLLVLSEEGELHLVEANAAKFVHLSQIEALTGKTWNNLCLYGKKLLVRNAEEAACFELP